MNPANLVISMATQITSYGKSSSVLSESLFESPITGRGAEKATADFSILIIDNHVDDLRFIRPLTKWTHPSASYRVEVTGDCSEALQALLSGAGALPHLIVVDIADQGRSCVNAIRSLKQNPRTRCVPIAMWASESDAEAVEAGYAAGVNCVARKPQSFEEAEAFLTKLGNFWFTVASLAS